MSIENARAAYPILVGLARESCAAIRERRPAVWASYDDFCRRCQDAGIKETPRTILAKLLRPIQQACLEKELPDLSALIVQKARSRGDFGAQYRPADGWWQPYTDRGEAEAGDVSFWFARYKAARDFDSWPEAPFF